MSFLQAVSSNVLITAVILCMATMAQPASGQSERFRVVVATGQPSPGTNGSFAGALGAAALDFNDAGHVAFTATFATADLPLEFMNGAWVNRGNGLEHIASSQRVLAGTSETIDWVSDVLINDTGNVAISVRNTDASSSIFSEEDEDLHFIAKTGQVAPGTSQEFEAFIPLAFTNDRNVILGGLLVDETSSFDGGVWINDAGTLTPIAFSGQELANGEVISHLGTQYGIAANRVGDLAFGTISTQSGCNDSVSSYWKYRDGQLTRVLQTGDIAPGTDLPFEAMVRSPRIDINREGGIAFPFRTSDSINVSGIWKESTNGLVEVVLTDDFIPDAEATVTTVWGRTQINARGDVAFAGGLTPGTHRLDTDLATFVEMDGELRTIVREGQPIAEYDLVSGHPAFANIQLNDQGMVAFSARIAGITASNFGLSNSLWIDVDGAPRLVLAPGNEVEVGLNDTRTFQFVRDFRLNNLGQVAFVAEFADRTSAILVSNPIVVPEPDTLLAAWLAIASACIIVRSYPCRFSKRSHK